MVQGDARMIILHKDGTFSSCASPYPECAFRKYVADDTFGTNEIKIVEHIHAHEIKYPHACKELIHIYGVDKYARFYDAEFLNTCHPYYENIVKDVQACLDVLHKLSIVYIDIKGDNIGWSQRDQRWKLFDFDCSGLCSKDGKHWTLAPPYNDTYARACNFAPNPETAQPYPLTELDKIIYDEWIRF